MLKKRIESIRRNVDMTSERFRILFSKIKPLLIGAAVIVFMSVVYLMIWRNWVTVKTIYQNAALIGVFGTLLGAVIGGLFSLIGSIAVNKNQIKTQSQIKRKEQIYIPLYDELMEIHNDILKRNPYPSYVVFRKGDQTTVPHPQFAVWKSIKADSRYLETPKKLTRVMEKLEKSIIAYTEVRSNAGDIFTEILNETLKKELDYEYNIDFLGPVIVGKVLANDNTFDLLEMLRQSRLAQGEIDKEAWTKAQNSFIDTVNRDHRILCLKSAYESWLKSEENAIQLLSLMIRRINAVYEK